MMEPGERSRDVLVPFKEVIVSSALRVNSSLYPTQLTKPVSIHPVYLPCPLTCREPWTILPRLMESKDQGPVKLQHQDKDRHTNKS